MREIHDFLRTETTRRRMGQNIARASLEEGDEVEAVESWYAEGKGYDYKNPGYQFGIGHFTAVLWYNTTHMGMARCGEFIVCNYYPRGNVVSRANGREDYAVNVYPPGTPKTLRPRNELEARLFEQFDCLAKGRDTIPRAELSMFFGALPGETGRRLMKAINEAADDRSGGVDPRSFAMAMTHPRDSDMANEDITTVVGLVRADDNGNMRLDAQELVRFLSQAMCRTYTQEEAEVILKRFDADSSGDLDYAELQKMVESGELGKAAKPTSTMITIEPFRWDDRIEKLLGDMKEAADAHLEEIKQHVLSGGSAEVTRLDGRIVVRLSRPGQMGHRRASFHTDYRRGAGGGIVRKAGAPLRMC